MARLLRPWQDLVREKLIGTERALPRVVAERAWFHLTNSYNSDGQWPPTLPEAPHIIHPFNYAYCFENLLTAHHLVGGVDVKGLATDAARTLSEILDPQAKLIEEKARTLAAGTPEQRRDAELALALLGVARERKSQRRKKTLDAAEYAVRADALVEARRRVGGVVIEKS